MISKVAVFITALVFSAPAISQAASKREFSNALNGRKFCQAFQDDGKSQIPSDTHCVQFQNGKMHDNAGTLSGKSAEESTYSFRYVSGGSAYEPLFGEVVVIKNGVEDRPYYLHGATLVHGSSARLNEVDPSR